MGCFTRVWEKKKAARHSSPAISGMSTRGLPHP